MQYGRRTAEKEKGIEKQRETVSRRISDTDRISRIDYAEYRLSRRERLECFGSYLLLDGCVSYLFFCSWIPFVLFLPGMVFFIREKKKTYQKKRQRQIIQQFLDGIQMMSSALAAGYSPENAIGEAVKELCRVYEPDTVIIREFRLIEVQIHMNRNMEALLLDFGRRSAVEDIRSFAEVFMTAKRSGGDLLSIIRNTIFCIRQKQETMQEIETALSGKVMEQNIMSLIPVLILAYVKLTSPEFLDSLYGNITGIAVMGICLVIYIAAYFWGRSIVRIEV